MKIDAATDRVEEAYWTVALMIEKGKYNGEIPSEEEFYAMKEAAYAEGENEMLASLAIEPSVVESMTSRPMTEEELSVLDPVLGHVRYSEVLDEKYARIWIERIIGTDEPENPFAEWNVYVDKQEFYGMIESDPEFWEYEVRAAIGYSLVAPYFGVHPTEVPEWQEWHEAADHEKVTKALEDALGFTEKRAAKDAAEEGE